MNPETRIMYRVELEDTMLEDPYLRAMGDKVVAAQEFIEQLDI